LLLKVNKSGVDSNQIMSILTNEINQVKNSLKLYPRIQDYHQEILITGHISEKEIYQIHSTCDCYVNTSHGEAWSIPTFDGQAFLNTIVAPVDHYDYLKHYIPYETFSDDVFGYNDTFHHLGHAKEKWLVPNMSSLRKAMRKAYEERNSDISKERHEHISSIINSHSIESIGKLMVEKLGEN
jgi:hypothetical protein